jgi:hypothetical protein
MKNFIIGALIIGVAIVVGFMLQKPNVQFGSSGASHYAFEHFYGGLTQGGGIVTATAGTTTTWTAAYVCDYSIIKWIPKEATNTTTIPSATAIISGCGLENNGDWKDVIFYNGASAASTTVFTMGTGVTSYIPEATGADKVIEGLNAARLRFVRIATSTVYMFIDEELVQ